MTVRQVSYPIAYGHELETSFCHMRKDRLQGMQVAAIPLDEQWYAYESYADDAGFILAPKDDPQFADDASRVYEDAEHLEMTIPETATPDEAVVYIRAIEEKLAGVAEHLLDWGYSQVIINNRVVDSEGNSFASHDSIGFAEDIENLSLQSEQAEDLESVLLGHLLTRGFVTGAGLVTKDGYRFSQKIAALCKSADTSVVKSEIYQFDNDYAEGVRCEVRCSDSNISPWATWMRLGSAAIALAVGQTQLAKNLGVITAVGDNKAIRQIAEQLNASPVSIDGRHDTRSDINLAIEYQEKLAKAFLSEEMRGYGKQPKELIEVARELLAYCADVRRVLYEGAHYSILADRADWAAKLVLIDKKMQADLADSKERHMGDARSMYHDLAYDTIHVSLDGRGRTIVRKGAGYKRRDTNGAFRRNPASSRVRHALRNAPQNTRARLRAHLLQKFEVVACGWDYVRVLGKNNSAIDIDLPHPSQTRFTKQQQGLLSHAVPRQRY